jgi:DNA polymerase I-like protein with 3'-5' exonuclease and polymerase domains
MNDLSRQLEDHKQQLRKSKEDLANSSAQLSSLKQLQDIVESDKRQISDLSRQL